MKIINLTEFRKMPEGTIFSKYAPFCFSGFMIKGETMDVDFGYADLCCDFDCIDSDDFMNKCTKMEEGHSMPISFYEYSRDGFFEKKQLFAIYERADVENLITVLQDTIK